PWLSLESSMVYWGASRQTRVRPHRPFDRRSCDRCYSGHVGRAADYSGRGGQHCPSCMPVTLFGPPPESPTWTVGLLPKQIRLRPTTLSVTSTASASLKVLSVRITFFWTWLRKMPNQHPWRPVMTTLPPMRLSSKSV